MKAPGVVVLGAGTSGLVAACLLARGGKRVLIVDQGSAAGGTGASETFHPGYRAPGLHHDAGFLSPSLLAGLELESLGLSWSAEPPSVYAAAPDGGGILVHHDSTAAAEEISRFSKRDAGRYAEYRAFLRKIEGPVRMFLDGPPPPVFEASLGKAAPLLKQAWGLRRLGEATMLEVLRVAPMCVADWVNEWFEAPFLGAALAMPGVATTFAGPWSPGTATNLLLHECGTRVHVKGGPGALAPALERAARQRGVELRFGARVEEILVREGRVTGLRLAGGEEIAAPVVVAACDPRHVFIDLIAPRHLHQQFDERIRSYRGTGLTAVLWLALSGPLEFGGREREPIARARIGGSMDDLERAFDPVKYDALPEAPSLDVFVPSLEDPSLAPTRHQVVSIHARSIPYRLEDGWTDAARETVASRILKRLEAAAPGVTDRVVGRKLLLPVDLEAKYGLVQGHLHHGDHALDQLLVRPTPECMHGRTPIEGLYLCGGGVHPGLRAPSID